MAATVVSHGSFSSLLRTWRQKRRLSQLELALSANVSQRHISFLESGRAQPSRDMILQLSETLDVPLRDRNGWLMAAGFAPVFAARPIEDPQMAQVAAAINLMLSNHEPFPAAALDRSWNIRLANSAFERLSASMADVWSAIGGTQRNIMRLFFHPNGIKPFITNWSAVAPLLWCRAQREAEISGRDDMRQLLAELSPYQDLPALLFAENAPLLPLIPLNFERSGGRLSVFTVISTFGTAQDITTDELRIETLFPADPQTRDLFTAAALTP